MPPRLTPMPSASPTLTGADCTLLRRRQRLSIAALAERANIKARVLEGFETGAEVLGERAMERLREALGVTEEPRGRVERGTLWTD
jgi:transcriptional regulator with XRE-family HTH domain